MYNVPVERVSKELQDQVDYLRQITPYMQAAGLDDSRLSMAWNSLSKVDPNDKRAVRQVQDKIGDGFERAKDHINTMLSSKAGRELGIDIQAPFSEKMEKLGQIVQRSEALTEGLKGFMPDEKIEEIRKGGAASVFEVVEGWQKAAKSKGWNPDSEKSEIENFRSAFIYMNETLPDREISDAMIAVFAGIAVVSGLIILGGLFKWLSGGGKK